MIGMVLSVCCPMVEFMVEQGAYISMMKINAAILTESSY
jgi:hypothetical protein